MLLSHLTFLQERWCHRTIFISLCMISRGYITQWILWFCCIPSARNQRSLWLCRPIKDSFCPVHLETLRSWFQWAYSPQHVQPWGLSREIPNPSTLLPLDSICPFFIFVASFFVCFCAFCQSVVFARLPFACRIKPSIDNVCLFPESDKEAGTPKDQALEASVVPKQLTSALSSLVVNYGSLSESESEHDGKPIELSSFHPGCLRKEVK